jgi:hypothetical protein
MHPKALSQNCTTTIFVSFASASLCCCTPPHTCIGRFDPVFMRPTNSFVHSPCASRSEEACKGRRHDIKYVYESSHTFRNVRVIICFNFIDKCTLRAIRVIVFQRLQRLSLNNALKAYNTCCKNFEKNNLYSI